ncbi:response regulator transcription factor [Algihabitans albus]|uniref:response regulator transcription factor n=1 Tax=Algihabitans albus TaxID=2164067 RepID=UPI000E5CFBF8|nr:response regulator transcription factor [Algihabitans albus]
MRVLVIEDNAELGAAVSRGLRNTGLTVDLFGTAEEAEEAWQLADYSAVVLDLMLPDGSGLDVLRSARRSGLSTPVLILTALDGIAERIAGLDAGADDYLTKPFHSEELAARLRALMRRSKLPIVREIEAGSMLIDLEARVARTGSATLSLSRSEFLALECLARNQGRTCSKETIANAIYGFEEEWSEGAIELHVHRLRRKLAVQPGMPRIKSLRGLGYMLVADLEN